tara:strand:- start:338 stop:967 length:630 start_codon:yes stop_codon:yes gene_type:complete
MRKHFLDLFSGLGGASEAFAQDSNNWSVCRIDNNPLLSEVPMTTIMDINDITPYSRSKSKRFFPRPPRIDCVWASPPCRDFSDGYSSPKSKWVREHGIDSYEPDMSLLETALHIIQTVEPRYWVIENVKGSIRYFKEYLGEPRQIIGPYVLWGNFPLLDVKPEMIIPKSGKDVHSSNPLRSNIRAKVDYAISESLKRGIEYQHSILDYS